ncbi:hypothetical protein ACIA78_08905 [Streptomyces xanthochromogenes]|uniref:hypothetical protein n=1 Tax=Streptomyces xanthochromogenes TaxID=67384 RepID=UPI003796B855
MTIDPGPLLPNSLAGDFDDTKAEHSELNRKINEFSYVVNSFGVTINGWSNTISVLSGSIEGLKVSIGLLAVGFTPLKIDGALMKVDEKGIVFAGKQKWTWPHARDEKQKQEAAEKRASKIHGELEKSGLRAEDSIEQARLNPHDAEKVRKAKEDISAFRVAYYNAKGDINRAQQMRDQAKAAEAAAKEAREKVQRDVQATGRNVQSLSQQLRDLERELVGH